VHLELAAIVLDELRERSLVSGDRRADDLLLACVRRRRLLLSIAVGPGARSYGGILV
jgi:hypothetical protein